MRRTYTKQNNTTTFAVYEKTAQGINMFAFTYTNLHTIFVLRRFLSYDEIIIKVYIRFTVLMFARYNSTPLCVGTKHE